MVGTSKRMFTVTILYVSRGTSKHSMFKTTIHGNLTSFNWQNYTVCLTQRYISIIFIHIQFDKLKNMYMVRSTKL